MFSENTGNNNPPDGWGICDSISSPELYSVFTRNDTSYYSLDSTTFCILRIRDDSTREHIFTQPTETLQKNYCYRFSGYFRHTYNGSGINSLTHPVILQLWAGMDSCLVETDYENFELLYESDTISSKQWKFYSFLFTVKKKNYPFFYLRVSWDIPAIDSGAYRGIVFMDNLSLEPLMAVDPPFMDSTLYYFSKDRLLKLDANVNGVSYLWNPPYAVNQYDTKSIYLIEYVDTLYATIQNSVDGCPSSYQYPIIYNCDTVYRVKLRKEENVYVYEYHPVILNASPGFKHEWLPSDFLSSDTVQNPQLVGYEKYIIDSLTYIDSITDFYGCKIAEMFHIIKDCEKINNQKIMKEIQDFYFKPGQNILFHALSGNEYSWNPSWNLDSDTIQTPRFIGYIDHFNDTLFYTVTITDIFGCTIEEYNRVIRNCDSIYPDNQPVLMMDTVLDKPVEIALVPQGTPFGSWKPSDRIYSPDSVHFFTTPVNSIVYTIRVLDSLFCEKTEIFSISISLFIPNVITPNGDGKNDYFIISDIPSGTSIFIFDKNGTLIYSNNNYGFNEWWDGRGRDGNLVETGNYWFALHLPGQETRKGFVFVKR